MPSARGQSQDTNARQQLQQPELENSIELRKKAAEYAPSSHAELPSPSRLDSGTRKIDESANDVVPQRSSPAHLNVHPLSPRSAESGKATNPIVAVSDASEKPLGTKST
jgi:hypothetical protein